VNLGHHHEDRRRRPGPPFGVDDRRERGASLVEYALLLSLIALVAVGAVSFLGERTGGQLDRSGSCFDAAAGGSPLPADC
jgi:Flp pilus assembly pilin Flp